MDTIILIISLMSLAVSVGVLITVTAKNKELSAKLDKATADNSAELTNRLATMKSELLTSLQDSLRLVGSSTADIQRTAATSQDSRMAELTNTLNESMKLLSGTLGEQLTRMDRRFEELSSGTFKQLEAVRTGVEARLTGLQDENSKKLEQIRVTVDEKLQSTLNTRLTQSFSLVNERLEQVYKGLGEMQSLATGVGDLKRVLANVKTRGILGEVQLGAILEQILSPEQYVTSYRPEDRVEVEFAVVLPGGDAPVYLPIDSKFPLDTYEHLLGAYEVGVPEQITVAWKELERKIKLEAKSIHDKYIKPPQTTDFAIMFLPVEGLYAEVVRRGMVETLLREFKVNIAGPTTMAALLNSLQMGFRTLAIQKHSGEVWNVLNAVKKEFGNFAGVLDKVQNRIKLTSDDLDKLIGTRTRAIQRTLRGVETQIESETETENEVVLLAEDE